MLRPSDQRWRDSTLVQFTTRPQRDFITPGYLLVQIQAQFDFSKLVALLEDRYCPAGG